MREVSGRRFFSWCLAALVLAIANPAWSQPTSVEGFWVVQKKGADALQAVKDYISRDRISVWHIYRSDKGYFLDCMGVGLFSEVLFFENVQVTGNRLKRSVTDDLYVDVTFDESGFEGTLRHYNTSYQVVGRPSPYVVEARTIAAEERKKREALETQVGAVERRNAELTEHVGNLQATVSTLRTNLEADAQRLKSLEEANGTMSRKIAESETRITDLLGSNNVLSSRNKEFEKKTSFQESTINNLMEEKGDLAVLKKDLEAKWSATRAELSAKKTELSNALIKIRSLQEDLAHAQPIIEFDAIANNETVTKPTKLHRGPSESDEAIEDMAPGTEIAFLAPVPDRPWKLVATKGGKVGYVLGEVLRKVDAKPEAEGGAKAADRINRINVVVPTLIQHGKEYRVRVVAKGVQTFVGYVESKVPLDRLTIDGRPVSVDSKDHSFTERIDIRKDGQTIEIVATDKQGGTFSLVIRVEIG